MFTVKPLYVFALAVMLASFLDRPACRPKDKSWESCNSPVTKIERNSGVWIDGQYVGYLKELKGGKKIVLLPGDHEVSVRQAGYKDFTKTVVVEPRQVQLFTVTMQKDPRALYPAANAATLSST